MTNYIKAEFFRIRNKKSILKYPIILYFLYLLTVIARLDAINVLDEGMGIFASIFPIIIGGMIFSTVYNDDLSNKTIPQVIGFGNNRRNIVFSKAIVLIITSIVIYFIGFFVFNLTFFVLGKNNFDIVRELVVGGILKSLVITLGFSMLSGVFAFSTQKSTTSMVLYVLLSTGVIGQIVYLLSTTEIIKNTFGDITKITFSVATKNLFLDSSKAFNWGIILMYIVLSLFFSTLLFNKKELEF